MAVLWHLSEDDSIQRFESRWNPEHDRAEPLVWAIDSEHVAAYWFPRECPRGAYWAMAETSDDDVDRFLSGDRSLRVHLVQGDCLAGMRSTRLVAYQLPPETFVPYGRAAGYWVSREPVEPLEPVELGDLLDQHAEAGIELRIVPNLWPVWQNVINTTLGFSGIRLRNLDIQST